MQTAPAERHVLIACALIRDEEGFAVQAYPDPGSPLGRALVERHGAGVLLRIGQGRQIDPDLLGMDGSPWTVGYGQTGPDIRLGTVWSRQTAERRLLDEVRALDAVVNGIWPGAQRLQAKARAALISLVYNRGSSLKDPKGRPGQRDEMRRIGPAVLALDYERIAQQIESMKRLWRGKGLDGLLKRRDTEASLVRQAAAEAQGAGNATP